MAGSYASGSTSVTTTAVLVAVVSAENSGILVSCSATTYFGAPGVTSETGLSVPANTVQWIPSAAGIEHALYAVTATGSSTVTWLFPEV